MKPLTLGTLSDFSPDFVADFAKTAARAVKAHIASSKLWMNAR